MMERLYELREKQQLPEHVIVRHLLASPDVSVQFAYPEGVGSYWLARAHELELREAYDELMASP
jgi:hypothetical protein